MIPLLWFTITELQKHSSKTGKLNQVAKLSKGSDSCAMTQGEPRTVAGTEITTRQRHVGWLLNSCKHTGHPAQGVQTDMWS